MNDNVNDNMNDNMNKNNNQGNYEHLDLPDVVDRTIKDSSPDVIKNLNVPGTPEKSCEKLFFNSQELEQQNKTVKPTNQTEGQKKKKSKGNKKKWAFRVACCPVWVCLQCILESPDEDDEKAFYD